MGKKTILTSERGARLDAADKGLTLRPGPRAGDGVVVGLLVPELRDQRGALDVGGAVEHPAHVAQVDEAHCRVVRSQGVRVHLRVRSLCKIINGFVSCHSSMLWRLVGNFLEGKPNRKYSVMI